MCTYNTKSTHTDHFEIQKRDSEESLLTFVNLHSHLTYLHTKDSTLLLEYNQSLTTASESRLFGSVVRALLFYCGDLGSIPSQGVGIFSAMLYTTLLEEGIGHARIQKVLSEGVQL